MSDTQEMVKTETAHRDMDAVLDKAIEGGKVVAQESGTIATPVPVPRVQVVPSEQAAAEVQQQSGRGPLALLDHSEHVGELLKALVKATLKFEEIDTNLTATVTSRREGARSYKYDYADLRQVNAAVRRPLAEEGLVLLHGAQPGSATSVRVRTELWHADSEQWFRTELLVGIVGTDPQAIANGISYAKRYNLLAILNLSPGAEDDDASTASGVQAEVRQKAAATDEKEFVVSTRVVKRGDKTFYGIKGSAAAGELFTADKEVYEACEEARIAKRAVRLAWSQQKFDGIEAQWIVEVS